jgi:hypothetical protein
MSDEYLDLNRLTQRIPLSKRSIREQIAAGHLIEGVHFRRPTGPGGKMIFFMSAVEKWLKGQDFDLRKDHLQKRSA